MEEDEVRVCPLRGGECGREGCAWWDGLIKSCAVVSLAIWLRRLEETVRELGEF